jgi:hypothetical protein
MLAALSLRKSTASTGGEIVLDVERTATRRVANRRRVQG